MSSVWRTYLVCASTNQVLAGPSLLNFWQQTRLVHSVWYDHRKKLYEVMTSVTPSQFIAVTFMTKMFVYWCHIRKNRSDLKQKSAKALCFAAAWQGGSMPKRQLQKHSCVCKKSTSHIPLHMILLFCNIQNSL